MMRAALQPAPCGCAACRAATLPHQDRSAAPAAAWAAREEISPADARLGHRLEDLRVGAPARSEAIQAQAAEERPSGEHLAPAGRGKPLPEAVRGKMEHAFGHDFSRVRIHEGRTSESLGAVAFTRGQDIHFAPGRYSPASRGGQELLGHELAHVVQQAHGRVAVPQGKGAPINADPALEAEADRLGRQAARGLLERGRDGVAAGRQGAGATLHGERAVQRQNGDQDERKKPIRGVLGGLLSGSIARNNLQQALALKGLINVDPKSRLAALLHTYPFARGQTGYGVNAGIGLIHSVFGGLGQGNVGTLFAQPGVKELLAKPSSLRSNFQVAQKEHAFWGNVSQGARTVGEGIGGGVGSLFSPRLRTLIQSGLGSAPGLARTPAALLFTLGLSQVHKEWKERSARSTSK